MKVWEQEYACPICGKVVRGNGGRTSHMRWHRREEEKMSHTKDAPVMDGTQACAAVAQGVINICEGITNIEQGSRVYNGMVNITRQANLIAAAPDLLAALRLGVDFCEDGTPEADRSPEEQTFLRFARAAIAKAEGRA